MDILESDYSQLYKNINRILKQSVMKICIFTHDKVSDTKNIVTERIKRGKYSHGNRN